MRKQWLITVLVLGVAALLLVACDNSENMVRKTVENAAWAAESALTSGKLDSIQPFFALHAAGSSEAGLDETWGALQRFAASLENSSQLQFQSFDVENVTVYKDAGLARATYRLHMSVVRNGEVAFGAVITQNLALLKTPQGWQISGGDQPQLSDVQGEWPLAAAE